MLKVENNGGDLAITGIAAGKPGESLESFATEHGIELEGTMTAFSLGPGDFLCASIKQEDETDDSQLEELLRWDIQQKILSDPGEFNFDFITIGDMKFSFAGQKKLIRKMAGSLANTLVDVEPIALFNGYEGSEGIENTSVMLVSVEAEGISSIVIENGLPVSIESFALNEDAIDEVFPALDHDAMSRVDNATLERLADDVLESVNRLTSAGENKENPTPEHLVLTGAALYAGDFKDIVENKATIAPVVFNPFVPYMQDVKELHQELAEMGSAFTTCFGLALRAMEV